MASITVRKLDERTKRGLRVRAARHGRSLEAEVREILRQAAAEQEPAEEHIVDAVRRIVEPMGGIDIEIPPRAPLASPIKFHK